jgi:serine O-acetyltransferase
MIIENGREPLLSLTMHQLRSLFLADQSDATNVSRCFDTVIERAHRSFSASENKYFRRDGKVFFDPLHTSQYCIYLYFLSNELYKRGCERSAAKVYALNKALNAVDLFYGVSLPDIWSCDHPVGSVIGRATFGNGFFFTQNCTVGNNKNNYPTIGENFKMMCGATVIGDCHVGDNVILSAHAYVKDESIPPCSIVFGTSPNLVIKTAIGKGQDYLGR